MTPLAWLLCKASEGFTKPLTLGLCKAPSLGASQNPLCRDLVKPLTLVLHEAPYLGGSQIPSLGSLQSSQGLLIGPYVGLYNTSCLGVLWSPLPRSFRKLLVWVLCKAPCLGPSWSPSCSKNAFVRNYMKFPNLHGKVMFGNFHLMGWGYSVEGHFPKNIFFSMEWLKSPDQHGKVIIPSISLWW